jgi:hypothetical protein
MLDPTLIRGCRLHELKRESVFQAFRDPQNFDEPVYLAGSINEVEVLVEPRGEIRFHANTIAAFPNRVGYAIDNIRFEVDRSSAEFRLRDEDFKRGEIVSYPGGLSIFAGDRRDTNLVTLLGAPLQYERGMVILAFSRWEIVIGHGAERNVLYHYTGEQLLFGPFDPDTDEEV